MKKIKEKEKKYTLEAELFTAEERLAFWDATYGRLKEEGLSDKSICNALKINVRQLRRFKKYAESEGEYEFPAEVAFMLTVMASKSKAESIDLMRKSGNTIKKLGWTGVVYKIIFHYFESLAITFTKMYAFDDFHTEAIRRAKCARMILEKVKE